MPPPDQHGEPRARVNIRDGLILATYRLVLLHVLYIPIIEATATSTAPGVAWIMVETARATRRVGASQETPKNFSVAERK